MPSRDVDDMNPHQRPFFILKKKKKTLLFYSIRFNLGKNLLHIFYYSITYTGKRVIKTLDFFFCFCWRNYDFKSTSFGWESQFFVIEREREREAHAISYKFIPKVTLHLQHPSLPLRAILVTILLHRQRRNCENLFLVLFLYFSSDNKLLLNQSYSIFILFPFLTHF